ncbi:unnamed protein product [Musa textilis]
MNAELSPFPSSSMQNMGILSGTAEKFHSSHARCLVGTKRSSCGRLPVSRLEILLSQNNTAEVGIAKTHSITVNGHNSS